MKYVFGVMTQRYKLESEDEIMAKVAMCLFLKTAAPIAIYSPEIMAFFPHEFLDNQETKDYVQEYALKKKGIMGKIMQSIKVVNTNESLAGGKNEKKKD